MNFSKLSMGAKVALIGGAVLVINLFLPWYSVSAGPFSVSLNAFDAEFFAWGGSFVAIAGAVVLLLKAMGTKDVNAGQFKTEQLALLLGGVGFILIVLRFLTESSAVSFGLFIGIAASAAVTYGAFMAMKDAGLKMPGMGGGSAS
ncbi:MAG TPA: hypothetical protein VJP05_02380 [Acidimicrobiia bacterium]|nr:hypothetical protein [Acidimicrobiia bacterium]